MYRRVIAGGVALLLISGCAANTSSRISSSSSAPAGTKDTQSAGAQDSLLNFRWSDSSSDEDTQQLVVTTGGTAITVDRSSPTGLVVRKLRLVTAHSILGRAVDRAKSPGQACANPDDTMRSLVTSGSGQWQYDRCRAGLRHLAETLLAEVKQSEAQPVPYLDSILQVGAGYGEPTREWPLRTALNDIGVQWSDDRQLAGCIRLSADDVRGLDKSWFGPNGTEVRTGRVTEPTSRVTFAPALPGDATCSETPPAPATDTITTLSNAVVLDTSVNILVPGSGGSRTVLYGNGDVISGKYGTGNYGTGQPSPTRFEKRHVSAATIRGMVAPITAMLRQPRRDVGCFVADGAGYQVRARTDQGSWDIFALNPGPCGWDAFTKALSDLDDAVANIGGPVTTVPEPPRST